MKRATAVVYHNFIAFCISIHALVKRATGEWIEEQGGTYISIHALVKRATKRQQTLRDDAIFQSTPS